MLFQGLERSGDIAAPCGALFLGEVVFLDGGLELFDLGHASLLVGVLEGGGHLIEVGVNALGDGRIRDVNGPLLGSGVNASEERSLLFAERRDGLLAEGHGSEHILFADLIGSSFDHGDVVGGAGDGELEIGVLLLIVGGVDDEFARIDVAADANAGGGAIERSACAHKRGACAHDAHAVRRVLAIDDERGRNYVDFLLEAVDETGANRTVDHTRGQDALVGRLRLALQIATRNASDSVHLLDEVHRQREEVVILFLIGDDGSHEHGRVALGDLNGTRSLLSQLAGGKAVGLPVELEGFSDVFHFLSLPLRLIAQSLFAPFLQAREQRLSLSRRPLYTQKPALRGLFA